MTTPAITDNDLGGNEARNLRVLPTTEDHRPTIRVGTEIMDVVDKGIAALAASDTDLYKRDGYLVHITQVDADDVMTFPGVSVDTPTIRRISVPTIRERLAKAARWLGQDQFGDWKRIVPSELIARCLLDRGHWRGIRPIVGILEAPTMRPDGSINQQTGYDAQTGFMLAPTIEFPAVKTTPTQEEGAHALSELVEVFEDFPYRSSADMSTTIASTLTVIARPAIVGSVPAFVFDASTRASGKTLQTDVVSILATGREASRMHFPGDDVELEKVLSSYAIRGSQIIAFDNITRPFGGEPLDKCLTAADTVDLRVLGRSEMQTLRWRSVILATSNNVQMGGDTARRSLISRLESQLEHPEERTNFKHKELLRWVRTNRGRLVVSCLTILRAYIVAGKPDMGLKPWGSFEAWSALIPPAIVFCGGANPMLTRPALDLNAEEPDKLALLAILINLQKIDRSGDGLTARSMIDVLYPPQVMRGGLILSDGFDTIREAIEYLVPRKPGYPPDATKLGNRLSKFKGRVVDGMKLMPAATKTRSGVVKWRVEKVN